MAVNRHQCSSHHDWMIPLFLIAASFVIAGTSTSGQWWALGFTPCGLSTIDDADNLNCTRCDTNRNPLLVDSQAQSEDCSGNMLHSLAKGARKAIIDCQSRFNESRWNCSTYSGENLFGSFINNGKTRETGLLNAYFSAGAIYALAEDCRVNKYDYCTCTRSRATDSKGKLVYTDCAADYDYAYRTIQEFIIDILDAVSLGGKVDKHNVELGAKLMHTQTLECDCHGISGTCGVRTCYFRTPTVPEVGDTLRVDYGGAIKVDSELQNELNGDIPVTEKDIIYSDPSPDFCVPNSTLGIPGVTGRKCDLRVDSTSSCNFLCCGFGHYRMRRTVPTEECTFVWCCDVVCTITGSVMVDEYFCNGPPSGAGGSNGDGNGDGNGGGKGLLDIK